jgi:hypothetical protein
MIDDPEAILRPVQLAQALDTALAYFGWLVAKIGLQRFSDRRPDVGIQLAEVLMGIAGEFDPKCHMAIVWP